MITIFVDVETYYDDEYSLRRMTPIEYILDPRFECIGWAVSSNGLAGFMSEAEFRTFVGKLTDLRAKGEKIAMVSHNATFDMSVLAHRFNFIPDLMIDTLGMSRAWYGHRFRSHSLEKLAEGLELGEKLDTIKNLKGMTSAAIRAAGIWDRLKVYALNDVVICQRIYERIMEEGFPAEELLVADSVLRCAVAPKFLLDRSLLHEHLAVTQAGKAELLARCGMHTRDDLMSNERFAQALASLGVDPPRKISLTTGKETYAFAKTDQDFLALEEHDDPQVQALVSARLGVKSTIEETRTQRLIDISNLDWSHLGTEPRMPVPLRYSGAHTHRLSGDWKLNMQNLRRGGKLRDALKALPGQVIVVADASQIEARGVAAFAGQEDLTQQFGSGADVYSIFASKIFGKEVNKKEHPIERFVGKTCLAEGTRVVTQRGLVPIECIELTDRLWDGVEWVCHSGVVFNGFKKTLNLCGVWLTPDHLVLSGEEWTPAQSVRDDSSIRSRALATAAASWSSRDTCGVNIGASKRCWSNATAEGPNTRSRQTTSVPSRAHDARSVAARPQAPSGTGSTLKPCPTTATVRDCSTGLPPPSLDATRHLARSTSITEPGVSTSMLPGTLTEPLFCDTRRRSMDGTTPSSTWTASTLIVDTSPATSASSAAPRMLETSEASQCSRSEFAHSKPSLPVFDLADAGPRNRFTIATDEGPLIVHNCILGLGYGLGWKKLQSSIKTMSKNQIGTVVELSDMEAKGAVDTYRTTYSRIPTCWNFLGSVLPSMTRKDCHIEYGPVVFQHERVGLPNGLYLYYHMLESSADGNWSFTYGGMRKYLYGGKLLENIIQALSRIVVMEAAMRIRRETGAHFIMQVHDELVFMVPEAEGEAFKQYLIGEMSRRPTWWPNIPLAAEGEVGLTYGDAK